jgi:thioesterase domain-containing protein/acyl carrier protein
LGRPELTAERFVKNPFMDEIRERTALRSTPPSDLLFKTGDWARYTENGMIEYVGRTDEQVKVRGHRIELGEVVSVLKKMPAIDNALALVREHNGEYQIVAYLVTQNSPSVRDVREFLGQQLPHYMIPAAYLFLAAFPLTPNGKIDRQALPSPNEATLQVATEFVAPTDDLEREIAELWSKTLKLPQVSITEDFFELGGHSLLAVKIFSEIDTNYGVNLPLAVLFENPTVQGIAARVREKQTQSRQNIVVKEQFSPIVRIQAGNPDRPPFFCVHGAGGNVLNFYDMVRHLDKDQPFYGIQAYGVEGKSQPLPTVEAMAVAYLREIRQVQNRGPYFIGGYSGGGLVAYDMAQRLQAIGAEVAVLALFDTYTPTQSERDITLDDHLQGLRDNGVGYLFKRSKSKMERSLNGLARDVKIRFYQNSDAPMPHELREVELTRHFFAAADEYMPANYSDRVDLFRAEKLWEIFSHVHDSLGWDEFVDELKIHKVPGDHDSLMLEPNVIALARKLQKIIRERSVEYALLTS